MTLTAKIMYELVKFYAGKPLETLQKMQQVVRPEEVRAQIAGETSSFSEPTRCSRECPTPTD